MVEVRAKMDLKAENLNQAADALMKAIGYRQQMIGIQGATSPYAAAALAKSFEAVGEVAQRRGDSMAAQDAVSQAQLLREQAHLPVAGAKPVA
jgi:hypothetical protein